MIPVLRVLIVKGHGQRRPRARSGTLVRTVASPSAAMAASCRLALTPDSRLAQKRVPMSTPSAPSISAAARPRPSAMPPAARSRVSGRCSPRKSATSATKLIVPRLAPWPPASEPWATTTSASAASASRTCRSVWHWQISGTPAALTLAAKGARSPKDSITALGLRARASSRRWPRSARAQVMKPTPICTPPASSKARPMSCSRP
mmetsp:Transcript_72594/g.216687  ORF Transcript_72594/g.216687 Transcript_72594/m.216687 type:complete len:205 (-) Transcript_72594:8-622(-)